MVSEKKLASNRRNALRSTGPKTHEGKIRVSENAVTHGLSSVRAVLRGEDGAKYEELRKDVYYREQPEGPMEEAMADQIVAHFLRLPRIDRAERAYLNDLVTRAAGHRTSEIEPGRMVVEGKLHTFEDEIEQPIFEERKDIEVTPEDVDSGLGASVSDAQAMKASRLLETNRQSSLRGIVRCQDQLNALQERRLMIESLAPPPPRAPPPADGPRRSSIADDDEPRGGAGK